MGAQIDVVVLRCADVRATRDFYAALGLDLTEERHGDGPVHYSAALGSAVVELYPATDRFPVDGATIGLTLDEPTIDGPLTDPDGRRVMITSRAPG